MFLVAGLLAGCGSSTPRIVSDSIESTVVATTVPATTTAPTAPPVFDPECHESVRATPATIDPTDGMRETFGPLDPEPGFTITLPRVWDGDGEPSQPLPGAFRIPGGVLVTASTSDEPTFPPPARAGMVAAIDFDGEVRWVRCFDQIVQIRQLTPFDEQPTELAVVLGSGSDDGPIDYQARVLSLADGSLGATTDVPEWPPYQPTSPEVTFFLPDGMLADGLLGRAADGTVLWTDRTIAEPGGEGQFVVSGNTVSVVIGCLTAGGLGNGPMGCAHHVLRGYNPSDGTVIWERAGRFNLSRVVDDGFAIVWDVDDDRSTWLMIDTSTGQDVPGQSWTGISGFSDGCCGEIGYYYARHAGGVVIAAAGDVITVWFPEGTGIGPSEISLP